jgi:hypothetical protein
MSDERCSGGRRRLLQLSVSLVALSLADDVTAGDARLDFGTAIDVAGRQRMLTQRIVKAYCQVGLDVAPDVSRAQLAAAMDRFGRQLADLTHRAPTADARRAATRIGHAWGPFKRDALGPVSRATARRLIAQSESLLVAANDLVRLLQDAAATSQARLVNTAGRQRMLSQRLAKLYMVRAWKIEIPGLREDMDAAAAEFDGALAALRSAPENAPSIAAELGAVAMQWEWFRNALDLEGAASSPYVVADASESILSSMELITAKYVALAGA